MEGTMEKILSSALGYAELGYPVFPCVPGGKRPLTKHGFKDATTDPEQIRAWWTQNPDANVAMPTAGMLVVDIDGADNPWPSDQEKVNDLASCPVSLTAGGGRHHIFRQPEGASWNNTASKIASKVDTRGNGGYIVLPPSIVDGKPYRWATDFEVRLADLPEPPGWLVELLDGNGDMFAQAVASCGGGESCGQSCAPVAPKGAVSSLDGNLIPAGQRNGTLARLAGAMRRVGMSQAEILAALAKINQDRCRPSLPDREVGRIAASIARYEPDQISVAVAEDHWGQNNSALGETAGSVLDIPDPGPLPAELLRIPGFVSEVMDYCLETAPYPNSVMAFAGALALQAVLAGRKVRDPGDNRTNIYLLGLAHSSAGKDRPRKINAEILHTLGLSGQIGGRFASGEGLQDALFTEPSMLFQTDEIDGMLQSINKARDARYESIMETLLTMYSSANSIFPMRRKAGRDAPGAIDQPCLVVFGTAIPNHYYEALSERMLTNGFFARMIVLECGNRSTGREPQLLPLPGRVLDTARWWADFRVGTGNLDNWHPVPKIVPHTVSASRVMVETRLEAEAEYAKAEAADDSVGTTVWGRVSEHARKLALTYAVSENHDKPEIGKTAASWASRLVLHQTRRMLFMAQSHVADNPFQAECLRFLQKLRAAPDRVLPHGVLLKRMKMDAKSFSGLVTTLEQRGDIVVQMQATSGRTGRIYRLAESSSVPTKGGR